MAGVYLVHFATFSVVQVPVTLALCQTLALRPVLLAVNDAAVALSTAIWAVIAVMAFNESRRDGAGDATARVFD